MLTKQSKKKNFTFWIAASGRIILIPILQLIFTPPRNDTIVSIFIK